MRKDTDMFTNFASFRNQLRKKIVSKLHNKQFNFLGVKLQQKKTPTKTMSINRETRDNQSFKRKNVFTMNVSTGKLLDGKYLRLLYPISVIVVSIEVLVGVIHSVVTVMNTIRVDHWNKLKDKVVSKKLCPNVVLL